MGTEGVDEPTHLSQLHECTKCATVFDLDWYIEVQDKEQMVDTDIPVALAVCPNPNCGHEEQVPYEGWTSYSDGA